MATTNRQPAGPPINIKNVAKDPPRTVAAAIYGKDKVGKTSFSGTFPGPILFIVPGVERGTHSLHRLAQGGKQIEYVEVNSIAEMEMVLVYVCNHYEERKWRTVVIDPFTTYGILVDLETAQGFSGDGRQRYGIVRRHLLNVWNAFQGLPLHTVWIFHADENRSGDFIVEYKPLLVGSALRVILANVDIIGYMERTEQQLRDEQGQPRVNEAGQQMTQVIRGVYTSCPPGRTPPFVASSRFENELQGGFFYPDWSVFANLLQGVCKVD